MTGKVEDLRSILRGRLDEVKLTLMLSAAANRRKIDSWRVDLKLGTITHQEFVVLAMSQQSAEIEKIRMTLDKTKAELLSLLFEEI